jgi:hypothetical protein
MEHLSLHPLPSGAVSTFLELIAAGPSSDGNTAAGFASQFWFRKVAQNPNPRPNDLTFGLAAWLASWQPVFAQRGLSLSSWEARVDRGSGMVLRPPSRLFIDGGLDPAIARSMPIRIESGDSMMGGAWIPARLVPQYLERLDRNLERSVRRLNEAELDGPALMGLMYEITRYAADRDMGLYEAIDLLDAADPGTWPPGAQVISRTTDQTLIERIRAATQPPKEPGLIARFLGRTR